MARGGARGSPWASPRPRPPGRPPPAAGDAVSAERRVSSTGSRAPWAFADGARGERAEEAGFRKESLRLGGRRRG